MSAGSKWIKGTEPQQPVTHAARNALAVRLGRVLHFLPKAAEDWEHDTEHVHQLRVATRRAAATLDAFSDLLSARRYKKMHKKLARIRKAAGDARDCDVLLARFRAEAESNPAAAELTKELWRKRRDAQQPLEDVARQLDKHDFSGKVQRLLHKVRFRRTGEQEPTVLEAGQRRLRSALDEFWLIAAGQPSQPAELHKLRIAAKALRYSAEIFAGAMPAVLRAEVYPYVVTLQETLGAVNDHATAAERFREWADDGEHPAFADYFRRLAEEEDASTARCRDKFFELWTPARQAQLHQQFEAALSDAHGHAVNADSMETDSLAAQVMACIPVDSLAQSQRPSPSQFAVLPAKSSPAAVLPAEAT